MAHSETTKLLLANNWNDHNTIIQLWLNAKKELAIALIKEKDLRIAVFEIKFTEPKEGINRIALSNSYALKADYKFNYNLKNKEGQTEAALERIARLGNEGTFIADRLVRWQPELSITEYRKLSPEIKKEIDTVLEIKPALPSLTLEEPKHE